MPAVAEVGGYIDTQLGQAATGYLAPYAQIDRATGRAAGATSYFNPRLWPGQEDRLLAVEVGFSTGRGRPSA